MWQKKLFWGQIKSRGLSFNWLMFSLWFSYSCLMARGHNPFIFPMVFKTDSAYIMISGRKCIIWWRRKRYGFVNTFEFLFLLQAYTFVDIPKQALSNYLWLLWSLKSNIFISDNINMATFLSFLNLLPIVNERLWSWEKQWPNV